MGEGANRCRVSSRGVSRPRSLDPTEMISTRTRRRPAAAAGVARPAVDYVFSEPEDTPPAPSVIAPVVVPPRASRSAVSRQIGSAVPMPSDSGLSATARVSASPSTPTSGPLLGSSPVPPAVEDIASSRAELDVLQSVASYSLSDWAGEQRSEPVCDVAVRYLQLDKPSVLPPGFRDHVPLHRRPSLSDICELAVKGRLHVDDDGGILLVRKPTPASSTRPGGCCLWYGLLVVKLTGWLFRVFFPASFLLLVPCV